VAKKDYGIMVCVRNSAVSRSKEGSTPCTGEVALQVLCSVLGPSLEERHRGPGPCTEKDNEAVRGLEHRPYGMRLRELG